MRFATCLEFVNGWFVVPSGLEIVLKNVAVDLVYWVPPIRENNVILGDNFVTFKAV